MKYAVIVIAGHRCAGKSALARALRRRGYGVLNLGTLLGPIGFQHCFNDEPLPVDFLIERYGGGVSVFPLFAACIRRLTVQRKLLFIDSAKSAADVKALGAIVPGAEIHILFLDCELAERHRRFRRRSREHDCSAEALQAADRTLLTAGMDRLQARASWHLPAGNGAEAKIGAWLDAELPRFLRSRSIAPLRRPPPVRNAEITGQELNGLFAPAARDALRKVAATGPLKDHESALDAMLTDAAQARTDWQRLDAVRRHERNFVKTARPMHTLFSAYGRAMKDRLRHGTPWRAGARPSWPPGRVVASPFLAPVTNRLMEILGAERRSFLLAASAEDAADHDRLRTLAAERMDLNPWPLPHS